MNVFELYGWFTLRDIDGVPFGEIRLDKKKFVSSDQALLSVVCVNYDVPVESISF